jgi:hypothetical protein
MATYKQPRRFNWVSMPVYLVIAAAIYCGAQFGPHVWRNLTVDEIVRDAVNQYWYQTRGTSASEAPQELREGVERKILAAAPDARDLELSFDRESTDLRVTARYHIVVKHPFVKKTTKLSFAPTAATPIVNSRL